MFFEWIVLIIAIGVNGQPVHRASFSKLFDKQIKKYPEIQPEINNSCQIEFESHDLHLICPTDVNCYFTTHFKRNIIDLFNDNVNVEYPCKTKNDTTPLSVNKTRQLNAVLQILRLANTTVCEFSAVETLDTRYSGLANMAQLGGVDCRTDHGDVSTCPYQLKYLNFYHLKIEHLFNNSFCLFEQLQYLGLYDCGVKAIEPDAFIYLTHLKEILLHRNRIVTLPVTLFKNNMVLQTVNLNENQLKFRALCACFSTKSLRYLFISKNNMTFYNNFLSFPSHLEQLFIDSNNLINVSLGFNNSKNLTRVMMDSCNISHIDETLFSPLYEVKIINLNDNKIETLPENTFKSNVELKGLWLKDNKLIHFPPVAHLRNLREIHLTNNKISFVNESDLLNCTQLAYIDLSHNELSFVESNAFDGVTQLQKLVLSHNRLSQTTVNFITSNILEINLEFNRFTEFSFQILSRSLVKLSMAFNQIETIEPFQFNYCKSKAEWNLTHLCLSNNRIASIANLKLPNSIEKIDVSHNQIREILTLDDILNQELISLRWIDLRENLVSTLCKYLFYNSISLNIRVSYYVSGNPLRCSCENMWLKNAQTYDSFTVEDLNSVHCQQMYPFKKAKTYARLTQLNNDEFLCQSDHANSNRCECTQPVGIQCELPCPTNCTCLSNYLRTNIYFMCKCKDFKRIPADFINKSEYYANTTMNALDLSGNFIARLDKIDFGDFTTQFTQLILSNSGVEYVYKNAFDKLIHLQKLDLANNLLEALPDKIFCQLTQLTCLDLSNNRLIRLADDAFTSQNHLRNLYLHNNSLQLIALDQITRLNSLNNVTLDDNPWSCECDFIKSFRTFLVHSLTAVHNELQLNCSENGEKFNIPNFNMENCLTEIHLTALIVSLIFGFILALIVGLVFKWRYELQVLVYARYGLRMFHRKPPEEELTSKQYDAFIAYHSDDAEFLVNELLPGLEGISNPYRLCIHHRDFPAGAIIQDCILEAIRISSRTIVVLSENFVKSGWCRFEFKSAHIQMLEDRCPLVLVIVLGEVPRMLDAEMKLYLKTNTYLRWGEKLFWQKLYYAMPERRVTSPPTDIMPMRDF